ncbi:lasso peptide biosynthesis B2 protein [Sphingomonas sp. Leaf33]|uniref:lasso peptide biosynthesis B2 protein n=1 Tax=Sphingomonas sp. Leaf33 TaxID=1736215 RepID=UPI0009E74626|nr:lasso peptide biosynthesis B2 protein [Sphingomonas sp. Leaf33]
MSVEGVSRAARVAEAAIMLAAARLLVAVSGSSFWRRWKVQLGDDAREHRMALIDTAGIETVTRAVRQADRRRRYHCLPRAMATHWMLTRRGVDSCPRLGIVPPSNDGHRPTHHAWIEVDARVVMGEQSARDYYKIMAWKTSSTG